MWRRFVWLGLILSATAVLAQTPAELRCARLLTSGIELCTEHQYNLGLWALNRAAQLAPNDPALHLWAGHALLQLGDTTGGTNELQAALGAPTATPVARAAALNYLGVAAALRGEPAADGLLAQAEALATPLTPVVQDSRRVLAAKGPATWLEGVRVPLAGAAPAVGGLPVPCVQLVDGRGALEAAMRIEANDPNQAVRLYQWILANGGDADAARMRLGVTYLAKGWLIESIQVMREEAQQPTDQGRLVAAQLPQRLAQARSGLALEPTELLTSAHFRVRYAGDTKAAQVTLATLETIRASLRELFGVELPTVYVRLFPTRALMYQYSALVAPNSAATWASAYAVPVPHSPAIVAAIENRTAPTIDMAHEHSHLAWHALAGPQAQIPHWLDEGLAEVAANGRQPVQIDLTALAKQNRLFTPQALEAAWTGRTASGQTMGLCYEEAHAVVSYLLQTAGTAPAIETLLYLRRGLSIDQALSAATGMTTAQWFSAWAQRCCR